MYESAREAVWDIRERELGLHNFGKNKILIPGVCGNWGVPSQEGGTYGN